MRNERNGPRRPFLVYVLYARNGYGKQHERSERKRSTMEVISRMKSTHIHNEISRGLLVLFRCCGLEGSTYRGEVMVFFQRYIYLSSTQRKPVSNKLGNSLLKKKNDNARLMIIKHELTRISIPKPISPSTPREGLTMTRLNWTQGN